MRTDRPSTPSSASAARDPNRPSRRRALARLVRPGVLAFALAVAVPGPGAAQDSGAAVSPGDGTAAWLAPGAVEVSLLAGALAPVSRLTEDTETFSTELTTAGFLAADGVYWIRGRYGLAIRAGYAPATVAVVPGSIAGAVPEDLGPADYWTVSAEGRVRFSPPGEGIALVPYLSAGGGVRLLDVRALAGPEVEDSTDPMASVAGGAVMPLAAPVDLRIELRDHLTFYETPAGESRLQNELAVLIGASLRVR